MSAGLLAVMSAVNAQTVEQLFSAVSFTGSGNIVYNDNYYRIGSNISHFDLSLSMTVPAGRFTLTPMVTYQHAIADDFENYLTGILMLRGDF